jgi:hypothetical protein
MIPASTAPYGVTINVYLPLLSLSLGYVQVRGMWQETGRMVQPHASRKGVRPAAAAWQKLTAPSPRAWKTEKP